VRNASIKGHYPGFIFQNYDVPMKVPVIVNNGHSSELFACLSFNLDWASNSRHQRNNAQQSMSAMICPINFR